MLQSITQWFQKAKTDVAADVTTVETVVEKDAATLTKELGDAQAQIATLQSWVTKYEPMIQSFVTQMQSVQTALTSKTP